MILTSFHSADPSTPMGVRCGKCLWVIHRPAIWAYESTCLLENLCAFLDVYLALACLCELLQLHIWLTYFAMMILTSFHSADPSTPAGVRCGKCLWVIHRPAIWAYESTCLMENLCAFLDVELALACLCEWLQLHIWLTYFAMMILTSFHSADPSTPTGVRCGKCLWVIHRPAIWAYESTCLLENLCAFLDVYLALACLCEWLEADIWVVFCAMMILTSFHSADPSTPTGVRCGKCLWVIHRPAVWAYESTCLWENLCAFLDVYLALACLCESLEVDIWVVFCAMMILTSFHSADPSTPTGVRCGKCLWVIHRPAIWAYESTCLLENLCAFLDVSLALACLFEWLEVDIWVVFCAMMILTSFHSADPRTPTGVRCGKCLWVIHRPAIWAYESTCLLENLCAFLDVYLALACLCEWLEVDIWVVFCAMMILTSFHSADPSTPTGVRCGKCLWVIHRPAIWAYESTCLLENLCAFLDVYLALACLCEWLEADIWVVFCAMMILTSFHSADPSTPTGVRCGKCLWVIHRPAIWAYESTCLLENLCAFLDVYLALACLCELLQLHIWLTDFCHDDPYKFPFGRP